MLAMHVPLPALALPWLARADGLWFLPGGLLAFALMGRTIADMWTSGDVAEEARPPWIAALVVVAPLALIAYWWRYLRQRRIPRPAAPRDPAAPGPAERLSS
jgi:hypothetical protein